MLLLASPFLANGSLHDAELAGPCSFLMGCGDKAPTPQLSSSSSPVPYDICRPDHSVLTVQLPVTASVREVMAALAHEDHWTKGQVLVKVNSAGGELFLWMDSQPWEGTLRPTPMPLNSCPAFVAGLPQLLCQL